MSRSADWYRLVGIRTAETRSAWLFFAHHFLLGAGTVLVYVAATVLLLGLPHPERSLPLGYLAGAGAMLAIGRIYHYFEHHLPLLRLAQRVLWAVLLLTATAAVVLAVGPSLAAAVAIMAGYRGIYLLSSLEFWGVSAVVFDVRQGRRLFSFISAGDLPAKALGALLATQVATVAQLLPVLLAALGAYAGAMLVLRLIGLQHRVAVPHRVLARPMASTRLRQVLGNPLLLTMGLSAAALAAVGTGVEYLFFVHVKYHPKGAVELPEQAALVHNIALGLAAAYVLTMLLKLLVSRHVLDRLGMRWSLTVLPGALLLGLLVGLPLAGRTGAGLAYYWGLYAAAEVLRRVVFEPVFLVMFQPLAARERLQGHTRVKAVFEPLGVGIGAGLIGMMHVDQVGQLLWMLMLATAALLLLRSSFRHYLSALQQALSRRFVGTGELALPTTALLFVRRNLQSPRVPEVLTAFDWLREHYPAVLAEEGPRLLAHPDAQVRLRALAVVEAEQVSAEWLREQALSAPEPALRQTAARLLARRPELPPEQLLQLLHAPPLPSRVEVIRGRLEAVPTCAHAHRALHELATAAAPAEQLAGLALAEFFPAATQRQLIEAGLGSPEPAVVAAALHQVATLRLLPFVPELLAALQKPGLRHQAATGLISWGAAVVPLLEAAAEAADATLAHRLARVLGDIPSPESRRALQTLVRSPNVFVRGAALRALPATADPAHAAFFQQQLHRELHWAHQLLHGAVQAPAELNSALEYELRTLQQRVLDILRQLYDPACVASAQRGLLLATPEQQANALEILDNLVPRPVYQCLQALVECGDRAAQRQVFDEVLGPLPPQMTLPALVAVHGEAAFTPWTLSLALRTWAPEPHEVRLLLPLLHSASALVREALLTALHRLRDAGYGRYQQILLAHPALIHFAMDHHASSALVPELERVLLLRNTALFADIPENVLSSIVPIMQEETHPAGATIFAKGEPGTGLFVVCAGEVAIIDEGTILADFGPGDYFGELALFDAAPRSATAVAVGSTVVLRLEQEDLYELMEERPEVLRNMLRTLGQRLRRQNQRLHALSVAADGAQPAAAAG